MKKTYTILLFFLSIILLSHQTSARLTTSMNCTFSCSGKRCVNESHTLVACMASCKPAYYKECWQAGKEKFNEYKSGNLKLTDPYFKEFEQLDEKTKELIEETLNMAQIVSTEELLKDETLMSAEYEALRNNMKAALRLNLISTSQEVKNWVRNALNLKVKNAGTVLNLGISMPS